MYNRLKIGTKIVLLVFLLVVVAVVAESFISYYRYRDNVQDAYLSKLELIATLQKQKTTEFFDDLETGLDSLANQDIFYKQNGNFIKLDTTRGTELRVWRQAFNEHLSLDQFLHYKGIQDLYIIKDNSILYQQTNMDVASEDFHNMDNLTVDIHKSKFKINAPIREESPDQASKKAFFYYVTTPIYEKANKQGAIQGYFMAKILASDVVNLMTIDSTLLDRNYVVKVFKKDQNQVFDIDRASQHSYAALAEDHPVDQASSPGKEDHGKGIFEDEDGISYFALWRYDYDLGVGMMISVECTDAYEGMLEEFNLTSALIGIIIVLLSLIFSYFFARIITFPMLKLKKVLNLVSNGVLPKELHTPLQDEVGDMIKIVNKIVSSLKKTAAFAIKIGEGEFDTNFKPISSKDTLGQALVNMRESLRNADEKDLLRNWIVTGVAEIGEILRNNDNLENLGDQILDYICLRIQAVQGAFYVVNEENMDDILIELRASYAYQKKKFLKGEYRFAEGLVGQSAVERDMILRTEIPDDYMNITSGLIGDQKPTCILILPLMNEEMVYGVLEFASFKKFNDGQIQFLKEVSEIIARTIQSVKVNEHTKNLLLQSQRMSSELQIQQEELQQNAVEMEKNQEQLNETNVKLEQQITEVNNAQKRIQALLENASEVITIYDEQGIIKYVSPSVEKILGYKQEDLEGISDKKFINEVHQEEFEQMFQHLLVNERLENYTIQMSYFRKKGDKIWLEATGKNMLSDPAIEGIVVNSRDITERRRAEEEERKRGQMQALSENSPDLIVRMGLDGKLFYINPSISRLTGQLPEDFLNVEIAENPLDKKVLNKWLEIMNAVQEKDEKVFTEMRFPSNHGNRIMAVSAIPEYDLENVIESVLIVSHDVTEQKEIENEIKETNIKINDSINYAENIQEAILPDSLMIQETFRDSFIYFLPRDVVSGDFPWFVKNGDVAYIAAVDCTGHGVPGAMISLVGFFLLNNIIDDTGEQTSGEILDHLDALVTSTFKQDLESSKIKDGMDIAFCKVNLRTNEVDYAGANRPLYITRANGTFEEVKGDKFPIGGGSAYDNKTNFTSNTISTKEGDSIYFFSDGYPDQFGGADNTKFGPRRMREILEKTKENSLQEIHNTFDQKFQEWKGTGTQTDDVLLIGIRF